MSNSEGITGVTVDLDLSTVAMVYQEVERGLKQLQSALRLSLHEHTTTQGSKKTDASADWKSLQELQRRLHQSRGALELVNVPAAAQMLVIIAQVVQSFIDHPDTLKAESLAKVDRACFALLDFLQVLMNGKKIQPLGLFPQYQDVAKLNIQPADLWLHKWHWANVELPSDNQVSEGEQAEALSRRDKFMLGLLRGNLEAAKEFRTISLGLAFKHKSEQIGQFWALVAGFFDGIASQQIPLNNYTKRAASHILNIYKAFTQNKRDIQPSFVKTLLFFCVPGQKGAVQNGESHSLLDAVRKAYQLNALKITDYEVPLYGRFDPALVERARKRINTAKSVWSALSSGEPITPDAVAEAFSNTSESLQQLIPASQNFAQMLSGVASEIAARGQMPSAELALEIATAVLYVEAVFSDLEVNSAESEKRFNRLTERIMLVAKGNKPQPLDAWIEDLYRRVNDRETMGNVVGELRTMLEKVEGHIDGYLRKSQGIQSMSQATMDLRQIHGVLSVLGLDEAARATQMMEGQVNWLMKKEAVSSEQVDVERKERVNSLSNSLGALGFLIDMLAYQPLVARRMFVYDVENDEFKFLMGREATQQPELQTEEEVEVEIEAVDEPQQEVAVQHAEPVQLAVPASSSKKAPKPAEQEEGASAFMPTAYLPTTEGGDAFELSDTVQMSGKAKSVADLRLEGIELDVQEPDPDPVQESVAAKSEDAFEDSDDIIEIDGIEDFVDEVQTYASTVDGESESVQDEPVQEVVAQPTTPAPAMAAPEPVVQEVAQDLMDEDDFGDDLREIFLEEAQEVIENARIELEKLAANIADHDALITVRRSFHTLKGSSRMVGLTEFGAAAWACEQCFNEWIAQNVAIPHQVVDFAAWAFENFEGWVNSLLAGDADGKWSALAFEQKAQEVNVGHISSQPQDVADSAEMPAIEDQQQAIVENEASQEDDELSDLVITHEVADTVISGNSRAPQDWAATQPIYYAEPHVIVETKSAEPLSIDFGNLDLNLTSPKVSTEALTKLGNAEEFSLENTLAEFEQTLDAQDAFEQADALQLASEVPGDEDFSLDVEESDIYTDSAATSLSEQAQAQVVHSDEVAEQFSLASETETLSTAPQQEAASQTVKVVAGIEINEALYRLFIDEATVRIEHIESAVAEWQDAGQTEALELIEASAQALSESATTIGFLGLSSFAKDLEGAVERYRSAIMLHGVPEDRSSTGILQQVCAEFSRLLEQFGHGRLDIPRTDLLVALYQFRNTDFAAAQGSVTVATEGAAAQALEHDSIVDDSEIEEVVEFDTSVSEQDKALDIAAFDLDVLDTQEHVDEDVAEHLIISDSGYQEENLAVLAEAENTGTNDTSYDEIDPQEREAVVSELFVFFREEADGLLDRISLGLQEAKTGSGELLPDVRRALHTLKGSARLAGAMRLGNMTHELEEVVNRTVDTELLPADALANALARFEQIQAEYDLLCVAADSAGLLGNAAVPAATDPDQIDAYTDDLSVVEAAASPVILAVPAADMAFFKLDVQDRAAVSSELFEIFQEEAQDLLLRISSGLREWSNIPSDHEPLIDVLRALHTLKGSSRLAGAMHLGNMAHELETVLKTVNEQSQHASSEQIHDALGRLDDIDTEFETLCSASVEVVQGLVDPESTLPEQDAQEPEVSHTHADVAQDTFSSEDEMVVDISEDDESDQAFESGIALEEAATSVDDAPDTKVGFAVDQLDPSDCLALTTKLFAVFKEETNELLSLIENGLQQWQKSPKASRLVEPLRALHTIKGSSRLTGAKRLGRMVHTLESTLKIMENQQPSTEEFASIHDQFVRIESEFELLCQASEEIKSGRVAVPEMRAKDDIEDQPVADVVAAESSALQSLDPVDRSAVGAEYSEEAEPFADEQLETWTDEELQVIDVEQEDDADHAELEDEHIQPIDEDMAVQDSVLRQQWGDIPVAATTMTPTAAAVSMPADKAMPRAIKPTATRSVGGAGTGQLLRVRASLIDELVNKAGEVNMLRSQLAAEVRQLKDVLLQELSTNLERLRIQLRDVELQAETQLASRMESARVEGHGFDPLEFDRYTRIQELTRIMAESVNDVGTVQKTLLQAATTVEDGLAAQSRSARDLQRTLLRARMVEFMSIGERFHRVVRLTAKECHKQAQLTIIGGEIEVDRAVLDRIAPAFEHILRNCIVHGIEATQKRKALDKPAAGQITIKLEQEGNDVSISIVDDGAGLDLNKIRQKALKMGLIDSGSDVSDYDLAQMIYKSGLTTAEKVSELAGRGVGMDMAHAEIVGLGGRVEVLTKAHEGTEFRMVLPLTTAVTQVVMVSVAGKTYGIPVNLIESIQRFSDPIVSDAVKRNKVDYLNTEIPAYWLGGLLDLKSKPFRLGERKLQWLILRSAGQQVAIAVDHIIGSQEVVIKNVGPQFAHLTGFSGLAVLSGGGIILIYNPVALARTFGEHAHLAGIVHVPQDDFASSRLADGEGGSSSGIEQIEALEEHVSSTPRSNKVLVVDDSLTVRRVTQRLLERAGFEVALAKDGQDALNQITQEIPALVLSDIEMPRMDGFELVSRLRSRAETQMLPVIMITSRIAQKHHDYANELGVSHYLGKPYVEEELLKLVQQYVKQGSSTMH